MSKRLHHWILATAAAGVAVGACAQGAPDDSHGGDGNGWREHAHRDDGNRDDGNRNDSDRDEAGRGHHGEPGWHRHGPGMGGAGFAHLYRGLNLTPDQRLKMRTIILSARLQRLQQAGAHKAERVDRTALLNPGDPNYGAAVQAAKKSAADRIQRMSDLKVQLYNVLTPEQKSELSKRIGEWKARMAQRDAGSTGQPAPAAR